MSSSTTARLQRGVALGLALLLCTAPVLSDSVFEQVKRQHRQQSFIVVEQDGAYRVLFLDSLGETTIVDEQSIDIELLYEAVDREDPMVVARLVQALASPSRDTRLTAIRLLGEIDSADARAALESVFVSADEDMRLEAVDAIADAAGARRLLRIAALDKSYVIAETAREYLGERDGD